MEFYHTVCNLLRLAFKLSINPLRFLQVVFHGVNVLHLGSFIPLKDKWLDKLIFLFQFGVIMNKTTMNICIRLFG